MIDADKMCVFIATPLSVASAPFASANASAAVLLLPTTSASEAVSRNRRSAELERS
jgi:hypothetical protein